MPPTDGSRVPEACEPRREAGRGWAIGLLCESAAGLVPPLGPERLAGKAFGFRTCFVDGHRLGSRNAALNGHGIVDANKRRACGADGRPWISRDFSGELSGAAFARLVRGPALNARSSVAGSVRLGYGLPAPAISTSADSIRA
jgi:hypothetical protein